MRREELAAKRDRARRSVKAFYLMGTILAVLAGIEEVAAWAGVIGWVLILLAYNQDILADRYTRDLERATADDVR